MFFGDWQEVGLVFSWNRANSQKGATYGMHACNKDCALNWLLPGRQEPLGDTEMVFTLYLHAGTVP